MFGYYEFLLFGYTGQNYDTGWHSMCAKGMLASFCVAVTSGLQLLWVCVNVFHFLNIYIYVCVFTIAIMPILNSFFCVV